MVIADKVFILFVEIVIFLVVHWIVWLRISLPLPLEMRKRITAILEALDEREIW